MSIVDVWNIGFHCSRNKLFYRGNLPMLPWDLARASLLHPWKRKQFYILNEMLMPLLGDVMYTRLSLSKMAVSKDPQLYFGFSIKYLYNPTQPQ